MKSTWLFAGVVLSVLVACGESPAQEPVAEVKKTEPVLAGKWILEADGSVMLDPQTSGLTHRNGMLYSISDGSALQSQRLQIHEINPVTATLSAKADAMSMAGRVRRSCFAQYLSDEPDLEALVADPVQPGVFYTVTEDATRSGALSDSCQQRYESTGSTDYPTLLVRIESESDGRYSMTHVRPLQFPHEFAVGDFPNDGIEGMALSPDGILYLGLERDIAGNPRIFSVKLDDAFWEETDFAKVDDPNLAVPSFASGRHPINGLEYYSTANGQGFLLAAARNDNELWVIDTTKALPTKKISLQFSAPSGDPVNCAEQEIMDNASIEGLAVIGDTLWLINDPWKVNYMKNLQCEANRARYEGMAPLLFSMPLDSDWFKG